MATTTTATESSPSTAIFQQRRGTNVDYQRPRRPNPETIAYLKSLPLEVNAAATEIAEFLAKTTTTAASDHNKTSSDKNDDETELPAMFSASLSALDEIRHEIASLAGDEEAAHVLEQLAHITAPYSALAARIWLQSVSGYAIHLSTHRYGSHVLQTLLQLAVVTSSSSDVVQLEDGDLACHPDAPLVSGAPSTLPSLTDLILSIQQEITPVAYELATHVCGSHVLRTLICVLGGVRMLESTTKTAADFSTQVRRGKAKHKKKKKKSDEEVTSGPRGTSLDLLYERHSRIDSTEPRMQQALSEIATTLTGSDHPVEVTEPGDLQELACHPSAGPGLIVLLRTLTFGDDRISLEPQRRLDWTNKLEQWRDRVTRGVDHHLGQIRPEPRFSMHSPAHRLAQRLLCWQTKTSHDEDKTNDVDNSKPQEQPQDQRGTGDVIYRLAGEQRGSHVLEVLFRISSDEFYASILQTGDFLNAATLEAYIQHDVSNFVVQTLVATTRTAEQTMSIVNALLPIVRNGLVVLRSKKRRGILWRVVEAVRKFQNAIPSETQGKIADAIVVGFQAQASTRSSCHGLSDCIPHLLNIVRPENDGDRLGLDVPGTRCIYHLLHLDSKISEPVLDGILNLPADDLELLAKDSFGSRCIWDGMLEIANESTARKLEILVSTALQGRWVRLACDRVGHHCVKKLFHRLGSMKARIMLVQELSSGRSRLNGNAMGRQVVEACLVKEFHSIGEEKEWSKLVTKELRKVAWLKEITAGDVDLDHEFSEQRDVLGLSGKKKSKQKRKNDTEESSKKKQKSKGGGGTDLSMAAIMDTISVPVTSGSAQRRNRRS